MTGAAAEGTDAVRLAVDHDKCVGVGQCELLEPDVFRLDDDGDGLSHVIDGATLPRDRALVVVDKCPSAAIHIVEDAPGGPR